MKKCKFISIIVLSIISLSFIMGIFNVFNTNQSLASISEDINGIDESKYPGYKQLIKNLQSNPNYSNWKFKLYYTGLDWNEVIINESQGHFRKPKNVISTRKQL